MWVPYVGRLGRHETVVAKIGLEFGSGRAYVSAFEFLENRDYQAGIDTEAAFGTGAS